MEQGRREEADRRGNIGLRGKAAVGLVVLADPHRSLGKWVLTSFSSLRLF